LAQIYKKVESAKKRTKNLVVKEKDEKFGSQRIKSVCLVLSPLSY
jgi:hypothetical protein